MPEPSFAGTSNTTSTAESALEMLQNLAAANNRAVHDILRGDNLQAFRGIRLAAAVASRRAQGLLIKCEESSSRGGRRGQLDTNSGTADELQVHPIYVANMWSFADDKDYFFSCPFEILDTNSALREVGCPARLQRYMKALSSVAIFNMALSCHLQYRIADTCLKQEVLANRANALYEQATNLLEECRVRPEETVYLVYLAVCNNLMEVCLTLGHLGQAQQWKERLDERVRRAEACPFRKALLLTYFTDVQFLYAGIFAAARAA